MPDEIDRVLKSSLIKQEVPYRILLPDDYPPSGSRFPVLYLLHGLFGSFENWTGLTDLRSYSRKHRMIVVSPEGGDHWYTDTKDGAFESYLIRELIPEIDGSLRTISDRRGRSIAGNSMGGYGAFKFALKYPRLFGFAASFSGAFDAPRLCGPMVNVNWEELKPSILKTFGDPDSLTRLDNDIACILADLSREDIAALPYFYFDCGSRDGFLNMNIELSQTFGSYGVSYEFYEIEGEHDWQYWNSRLPHFLDLAAKRFEVSMTV